VPFSLQLENTICSPTKISDSAFDNTGVGRRFIFFAATTNEKQQEGEYYKMNGMQ
jgi:hypothetical protein